MKTIYCNGIGPELTVSVYDVNKKRTNHIGNAAIEDVFKARKEGNIRTFAMHHGKRVGVSEEAWQEFMGIHHDEKSLNMIQEQKANKALSQALSSKCWDHE